MRVGHQSGFILVISAWCLSLAGCACMNGGNCCGDRMVNCDSGPGSVSDCGGPQAGALDRCGPGFLEKLLEPRCPTTVSSSCSTNCGSGCGELYVDEWLNEPPTMDPCGQVACNSYGHQPVRSLLRLILGDGCSSDCETCCNSDSSFASPLIQDGYGQTAGHGNGCSNCVSGGTTTSTEGTANATIPTEVKGEPIVPEPVSPVPVPDENRVRKVPTPAPPVPKSAVRLNPALRKSFH